MKVLLCAVVAGLLLSALLIGLHQSAVQKKERLQAETEHLLQCARYDPECRATVAREARTLNLPEEARSALLAYVAYWEEENQKRKQRETAVAEAAKWAKMNEEMYAEMRRNAQARSQTAREMVELQDEMDRRAHERAMAADQLRALDMMNFNLMRIQQDVSDMEFRDAWRRLR